MNKLNLASEFNNHVRNIISQLSSHNHTNNDILRVKQLFTIFAKIDELAPIENMGQFILFFENSILSEDVPFLLNYDYTKFIYDNTIKETEEMIKSLINLCKNSWIKWVNNNDEVNMDLFKISILNLYLNAKQYGCVAIKLKLNNK